MGTQRCPGLGARKPWVRNSILLSPCCVAPNNCPKLRDLSVLLCRMGLNLSRVVHASHFGAWSMKLLVECTQGWCSELRACEHRRSGGLQHVILPPCELVTSLATEADRSFKKCNFRIDILHAKPGAGASFLLRESSGQ